MLQQMLAGPVTVNYFSPLQRCLQLNVFHCENNDSESPNHLLSHLRAISEHR